ncbi:MAG: radical SAM family heme chaperone HemW [Cyanobacteria bacterium]|nr:radical SAM family heme chaperone HemW [Cyanobacteriota bacterium]
MMYVYCHIPFCVSHCIYCDFYVVLEKYGGKDAYVDALIQEINGQLGNARNPIAPIETLYFGGGTPSLVSAEGYQRIFQALRQHTTFSESAEITLEANPKGFHPTNDKSSYMASPLEDYLACGFNRVSVGIQSFNSEELKRLSRIHSSQQAVDYVKALQSAGFQNISIDLMYGIPAQTLETWKQTLHQAVDLGIQHISMYGLKVEEGTPLEKLAQYPRYQTPNDERTVEMYVYAVDFLEEAGFLPYEISNLAKPGFASRHNLNYWNNGYFYGFGVSAHGYVADYRLKIPGT